MPHPSLLWKIGSFDQAGVAVGKETIASGDRVRIGGLDPLVPSERRDQHQQGRARQVEVGQQQVDGPEPVTGKNEQSGFACKVPHLAGLAGSTFEQAQARRTDRDNAPAVVAASLGCVWRSPVRARPIRYASCGRAGRRS